MGWRDDGHCFACGPKNPIGLHLQFEATSRGCRTRFRACKQHQGYEGIVHGGIVATLLDEVVVQLLWAMGVPAVTARLEVRFLRPAPVGEELEAEAVLVQAQGKILTAEASLKNALGDELATARAVCLRVSATSERNGSRGARLRSPRRTMPRQAGGQGSGGETDETARRLNDGKGAEAQGSRGGND